MAKRPAPFTVSLTDAERERLEAHRVVLGLRSLADVVRHWIAQPEVKAGAFRRFVEAEPMPGDLMGDYILDEPRRSGTLNPLKDSYHVRA